MRHRDPYNPASRIRSSTHVRSNLPVVVRLNICSTSIAVLDVPWKWYNETIPAPPLEIGASLTGVTRLDAIPAFGRADLIAGYKIALHCFCVSEQAGSGYLSLAEMLECKACQASNGDGWPAETLAPQREASDCKY